MKHLKQFENLNIPKIGDYVICVNKVSPTAHELDNFLKYNIGRIVSDKNQSHSHYPYIIKFDNFPVELSSYTTDYDQSEVMFKREEIIHYSENKKDLEMYISSNKYNL